MSHFWKKCGYQFFLIKIGRLAFLKHYRLLNKFKGNILNSLEINSQARLREKFWQKS